MKLFKPKIHNPGDQKVIEAEERIEDIKFTVHKFNNRPKPSDPKRVMIICCFSEFGCETVGAMYCLPQLMRDNPGHYKVAVGWHGREYLYRHLVDEFWEVNPEHMWLREYCRAFHHESKNLSKMEEALGQHGVVVPSAHLGQIAVGARCHACGAFWGVTGKVTQCVQCGKSDELQQSILGDVKHWRRLVTRIPPPSEEKMAIADKYVKPNSVGVFARGRKCYGRNLPPEFYKKLIELLEELNYSPIWLGEKVTTQPCPSDHIVDFSRMEEAKDLETTLAIISKCKFTIQFWTASTRLAGIMGVPYLLFESPDQIFGAGQEGFRRNLCDFGPRKLAINHFLSVLSDQDAGLGIVRRCIREMERGNYEDVIGLVENNKTIERMIHDNSRRIGG